MVTFINFYATLTQALTTYESPETRIFEYKGVQLLPDNEFPYVQTTKLPSGVNLEDWTVKVYSVCGELLQDITEYFTVVMPFDDNLGIPQIVWSLTNVPYDFGQNLVYLEITQSVGETFYTNPFWLTSQDSEYTTRFDYRDSETDTMNSIQLITWFKQYKNADEVTKYYEISTRNTVTSAYKQATFAVFKTEYFSNELMLRLRDLLNTKYLYVNLFRCSLFEVFEIPDVLGITNFSEVTYNLSVNESDVYDPLYVAPIPDPIPSTITVDVQAKKIGQDYFMNLSFDYPVGFETANLAFSDISINSETVGFNPELVFFNEDGALFISETVYNPSMMSPNVTLNNFTMRITDGVDTIDIAYTTPDIVFTNADIVGDIIKQAIAAVTTV